MKTNQDVRDGLESTVKLREGLYENVNPVKQREGQLLLIRGLFKFSRADFPDGLEVAAGFLWEAWGLFKKKDLLHLASWESAVIDASASLDRSSVEKLRLPSLAREWERLSGDETVRPARRSRVSISWVLCFTRPGFPRTLWMLSLLELRVRLELMEEEVGV